MKPFSNDDLRRELRDIDRLDRATSATADDLMSVAAAEGRVGEVLGNLTRRRLFKIGGYSITAAALLAACGTTYGETGIPQAGDAPTLATAPENTVDDAALLRTASSLEYSVINVYTKVIDAGLLSAPHKDLAAMFRDHHRGHAAFFGELTKDVGGVAFDKPNVAFDTNVIAKVLSEIEQSADKPGDMLRLAHALEGVAAATYQAFVPALAGYSNRRDIMVVGSVEARHAAALAGALGGKITFDPAVKETPPEGPNVPIYQVPSAFGNQGLTPVILNGRKVDLDVPGPNSYEYAEKASS